MIALCIYVDTTYLPTYVCVHVLGLVEGPYNGSGKNWFNHE